MLPRVNGCDVACWYITQQHNSKNKDFGGSSTAGNEDGHCNILRVTHPLHTGNIVMLVSVQRSDVKSQFTGYLATRCCFRNQKLLIAVQHGPWLKQRLV